MKVPLEYAMGTVRFSVGRFLSRRDIEDAAGQIVDAVKRLRPDPESRLFVGIVEDEVKLTHFTHGLVV